MNTGINILCYRSKTLANGEHPLMIRVCREGKKKYQSLGISVRADHWDFKRNRPKRNCPNQLRIEQLIAAKEQEYRETLLDLTTENRDFTPSTLLEHLHRPVTKLTVGELFQQHIASLKTDHRTGYALTFQELYNSLLRFNGHLDLYFSNIDTAWLKRYESWLRGEKYAENTLGRRFRTLRVLYNIALEQGIVKPEHYPFKSFKVSKLQRATAKRSITKQEIEQIIHHVSDDAYTRLAIDLFTFSYLTGGINFVDMAYLTVDNRIEHRLVYTRRKTHKLIRLPLQPTAEEILARYADRSTPYLFPILSPAHRTEQQQRNRIHKVITKVNRELKKVGRSLNLRIDLTTYVARHSFATVLKREGVSTSIICESLGHSSEKVTQIYLDNFENTQIDEAMKHLL